MQQVMEFSRRFQLTASLTSQAQEYYRLAEVKGLLSMKGVSAACLALVCLEIACVQHGEPLDKKQVQKLSGLRPTNYTTILHTVQRILGLSSHTSLKELAVKFGCLEAEALSRDILQQYREKMATVYTDTQKDLVDFSKPLYSAVALYTACKSMKIRCDRSQYQSVANCPSKAVFQSVLTQMHECVPKEQTGTSISKGRKRTSEQKDCEDEVNNDGGGEKGGRGRGERKAKRGGGRGQGWSMHHQSRRCCREPLSSRALCSPFSSDYLTWKERILTQARDKLESENLDHSD